MHRLKGTPLSIQFQSKIPGGKPYSRISVHSVTAILSEGKITSRSVKVLGMDSHKPDVDQDRSLSNVSTKWHHHIQTNSPNTPEAAPQRRDAVQHQLCHRSEQDTDQNVRQRQHGVSESNLKNISIRVSAHSHGPRIPLLLTEWSSKDVKQGGRRRRRRRSP